MRWSSFTRRSRLALCGLVIAGVSLALASCRSVVPNRDPLGEGFPVVSGTSLSGERFTMPADLRPPTVLLVGYVQRAQFDLDRWLFGLLSADLGVPIYEVPTVEGLVPRLMSGWIDSGMRGGIPEEDWPAVITVYGDAASIVAFTGNEAAQNGRVLVLDADGKVRFFRGRGFSAGTLAKLVEACRKLAPSRP